MKTLSWSAGIALLAVAVSVASADAATVKCQRTIAKASSQFVQAKIKALSKCEGSIVKGSITGPCPDTKTADSIVKATTKLTAAIGKSCGGDDKVCGGDLTNEDTPGSLGWPSACPNFEIGSCTNAIATCGDIATCLACVGEAAVDQATDLYYDDLVPNTTADKVLNKCQTSIGQATAAFLGAKTKALQKCWDARLNGKHGNSCAPPATGDGKYLAAIAKAEAKKIATICKACGGADQVCGGGDDFTPAQIGFPATCPAVTIPGGPACGGVITDLQSIVDCVDCVTEFKADCVDQLQVPQYVAYPTECNVCAAPAPTGPCPTSLEFTADGQNVDLDSGFTGLAHNAKVPTDGRITLTVSGCAGVSQPTCGQCNVNGPLENAGGVAFNNHRCQDQPWVQCSNNGDCITAGAAGPCVFFFGAPLPLVAGGVSTCILNQISGPVSGTINIDDGTSLTIVPLASKVHPTGGEFAPCPQCVAGLCTDGPRVTQPCSVSGTTIQFGDVSLDCPPNPGSSAGILGITLNIATGTQSRTLTADNPNCRQIGFTGLKCFCDTCNNDNQESCATNADCPSPPSGPIGPICGGKRCIGGTNSGAACNGPRQCAGGANDFTTCTVDSQCPGGACSPFCTVVCSGGTNNGAACSVDSECPGGDCPTLICNRPGESTQTNSCLEDTSTPAVGCQDIGNNQGQCPDGPIDKNCSIQTQRSCTFASDCAPSLSCPQCLAGQTCVVKNRPCFTDNGVIGNSVSVAGIPDTPCGGVSKPMVGSFFCIAPVGASAVNAAGGLPGLGRVRIPGIVVINP